MDDTLRRARFSTSAATVDVAAPGVDILSTAPKGLGTVVELKSEESDLTMAGQFLQYSEFPSGKGKAGVLVDCGLGTDQKCKGPGGHFCLIKR